jgi:hypothetical protein
VLVASIDATTGSAANQPPEFKTKPCNRDLKSFATESGVERKSSVRRQTGANSGRPFASLTLFERAVTALKSANSNFGIHSWKEYVAGIGIIQMWRRYHKRMEYTLRTSLRADATVWLIRMPAGQSSGAAVADSLRKSLGLERVRKALVAYLEFAASTA